MAQQPNVKGALAAGGIAAILASTCCLGPLVLLALGQRPSCREGAPAPAPRA